MEDLYMAPLEMLQILFLFTEMKNNYKQHKIVHFSCMKLIYLSYHGS